VGRKTPLPTPTRTYGASILGLIAPTELDTRHPLSKILDPPLVFRARRNAGFTDVVTVDERLFHALAAATRDARSPSDDLL